MGYDFGGFFFRFLEKSGLLYRAWSVCILVFILAQDYIQFVSYLFCFYLLLCVVVIFASVIMDWVFGM